MIDLRERLHLYDMVHKLTEQQKWQRLRLEQTQICMIGLADNVGSTSRRRARRCGESPRGRVSVT